MKHASIFRPWKKQGLSTDGLADIIKPQKGYGLHNKRCTRPIHKWSHDMSEKAKEHGEIKYWKLGCCWGRGKPDYYDFLLKNKIVICAAEKMEKGDWVLVCHGFQGDALAHIASEPVPCTSKPDLKEEFTRLQIDYEKWNQVASFDEWHTLDDNEKIYYPRQGGIGQIRQDRIIKQLEAIIQKGQEIKDG